MSSHYANMWDLNRQNQRAIWYSAGVHKHLPLCRQLRQYNPSKRKQRQQHHRHPDWVSCRPKSPSSWKETSKTAWKIQGWKLREAIKLISLLKKTLAIRDCSILWLNIATKWTTASQEKACILNSTSQKFQTHSQLHKASSSAFNPSCC